MTIDTVSPEGRKRELRNISLLLAKQGLQRAKAEIDYLIMATPSGDRRNTICDVNIHLMAAEDALNTLSSEES